MDVRIQVILGVWNIAAEAGTHFWCIKACMPKKSCCWEQTRVRNSQLNPYVMWSTYVYPYTYFEKQNIYIHASDKYGRVRIQEQNKYHFAATPRVARVTSIFKLHFFQPRQSQAKKVKNIPSPLMSQEEPAPPKPQIRGDG